MSAAVLEALIGRTAIGQGRKLEASLSDGAADRMAVPLCQDGTGRTPPAIHDGAALKLGKTPLIGGHEAAILTDRGPPWRSSQGVVSLEASLWTR